MPKKNKTLCVDDLRHAEYYGMQPVFDELYHLSLIHIFRLRLSL